MEKEGPGNARAHEPHLRPNQDDEMVPDPSQPSASDIETISCGLERSRRDDAEGRTFGSRKDEGESGRAEAA